MLHALDYTEDLGIPPEATGLDRIIERWDEVDIAMRNGFWSRLVEDLPELEEPFASLFQRLMRGWPSPDQDPTEAAEAFQAATRDAVRTATPPWCQPRGRTNQRSPTGRAGLGALVLRPGAGKSRVRPGMAPLLT